MEEINHKPIKQQQNEKQIQNIQLQKQKRYLKQKQQRQEKQKQQSQEIQEQLRQQKNIQQEQQLIG